VAEFPVVVIDELEVRKGALLFQQFGELYGLNLIIVS
jgi:hypothetical protein